MVQIIDGGRRLAPENNPCQMGHHGVHGALIHLLRWVMGDPKGAFRRVLKGTWRMGAQDLREKTPDQLVEELANLKKEAFNLRFQQATGQLENTARMRSVRRDAARVKTILNEKVQAAAGEGASE